ncbi:hypothetical protein OG579_16955 [Williamsia herbipolensis]|uniref:Uncharacterized protein n=1 Tax=Williamsia herbipolensis TaxID=1603258 RepID=A0AAU4JZZ9_9NOCA|nr:hypothetical protein [Williamsia herbipolensis]
MIDLDYMTTAEVTAAMAAVADHGPHFTATPQQKRNARIWRRYERELLDRNAFRHCMLNHRRDQRARRDDPFRPTNGGPQHCHKHEACIGHYVGLRGMTCDCPPRQLTLWAA